MTEITLRSSLTAMLTEYMGGDESIVRFARVSSGTSGSEQANKGLIRMLMRDRHGSPFEALVLQFRIECPIFAAREFMRHRIASYNETSGRYQVLQPVFYHPEPERPLRQIGKPGAYTFEQGSYEQVAVAIAEHERMAQECWDSYEHMLDKGIAREVARNVLPLSTYTTFYVNMNFRSLLNFLSLRWAHEKSTTPTFPLKEMEELAKQMDAAVRLVAPVAMAAFDEFGRIAP